MDILFQNIKICDTLSPFHGTVQDILIQNGLIAEVGTSLKADKNATIIDGQNCIAAPGFVDIFSHFNDPGLEQKETLETGAEAAVAGGFTHIFTVPNTLPTISSKTQVEYIVQKAKGLPVYISPIGAATKNAEGKEIAEMYDMRNSGAVAFGDGTKPVQSAGLFLKLLQYIKAFDGVLIQQPFDNSLSAHGLMNEGVVSTQLGLPGQPTISEEIMVQRDIELLKYAESKLHITGVSTAKSIALIQKAKEDGAQISCSVTPYHLTFCDEDLVHYDTNLKVNPPLRTKADRDALRQAVLDGCVDSIAVHHFPQHWDDKVVEFEYAKNGMTGLQTAVAAVLTAIPQISDEQLVVLFSTNARHIFQLNEATIKIGAPAEMTIFNRAGATELTHSNNRSRSANSPFMGKKLQGQIIGIVNKGQYYSN